MHDKEQHAASLNQQALETHCSQQVQVTFEGHTYHVYQPMLPSNLSLDELQQALNANRNLILKCQQGFKQALRDSMTISQFNSKPFNIVSTVQNAIMAHLNINLLIPQITLRGGEASFETAEMLSIQTRLEQMYRLAEHELQLERLPKVEKSEESDNSVKLPVGVSNPYATATLIVALVTLFFLLILSIR